VFVDREIDELPQADVVTISNDLSAETATQHLLDLGHRRIAFISGPLSTSTGRDRIAGFRKAMTGAGVEVDERLLYAIPFRGDAGSDAVSALLALPNPPTGMIVGNTAQVSNAVRRIRQAPIVVPDDLSLIVFDDNPWTELVTPSLSVIRQPIDMLALHSVELAVGRLKGSLAQRPRHIRVNAEFVQRSSTSPHPSSVTAG
jgi:LacI family transcriptional regulator